MSIRDMMMNPRASDCRDLTTENDRTPIVDGMRLYNYYDGVWGTVRFTKPIVINGKGMGGTIYDGWFDLVGDNGRTYSLNGVRVSTREV